MTKTPNVVPKILHPGRFVQISIFANIPDPIVGRKAWMEQILCYDTTVQDVVAAITDSLLKKGFVSADELRPDWKDKIDK